MNVINRCIVVIISFICVCFFIKDSVNIVLLLSYQLINN